jgi:hypothetical protein
MTEQSSRLLQQLFSDPGNQRFRDELSDWLHSERGDEEMATAISQPGQWVVDNEGHGTFIPSLNPNGRVRLGRLKPPPECQCGRGPRHGDSLTWQQDRWVCIGCRADSGEKESARPN